MTERTPIADGRIMFSTNGIHWTPAPNGIRVMLEEAIIPGEEQRADLVFNFTCEGVIRDIWNEGDNMATAAETYDEILEEMIGDE